MKVFWCDDYDRLYPVPAAAVVVAESADEARKLLAERLRQSHLSSEKFTLHEVNQSVAGVVKFDTGDY